MKILMTLIAIMLFSIFGFGQYSTSVVENYNKINSMSSLKDRKNFFTSQTREMKVFIIKEHLSRKLKEWNLSEKQIALIKPLKSLVTIEFLKNAEKDLTTASFEIAFKAVKDNFTESQVNELINIGDENTLTSVEISIVPILLVTNQNSFAGATLPQCTCNQNSWCSDTSCHAAMCSQTNGCGCFWAYKCNGVPGMPPS